MIVDNIMHNSERQNNALAQDCLKGDGDCWDDATALPRQPA
jgi:hypothetical protein